MKKKFSEKEYEEVYSKLSEALGGERSRGMLFSIMSRFIGLEAGLTYNIIPPGIMANAKNKISYFVSKTLNLKKPNKEVKAIDFLTRLVMVLKEHYEKKFPSQLETFCAEKKLDRFFLFAILAIYIKESAMCPGALIEKEEIVLSKGCWEQTKTKSGMIVWTCNALDNNKDSEED